MPAAGLRRPGPDGGPVRADLHPAPPHRPDHRDRGGRRAAAPTTSCSTSTRWRGWSADDRPVITFLCSPNNPTGRAEPLDERRSGGRRWRPGLVVVDEAYGQFAPSSALELIARGGAGLASAWWWSAPSPRPGRWPGCGSGYLVGPPEVVAACELVALPYHLDAANRWPGAWPCASSTRWRPGWPCSTRSGAGSPPPWPSCRVETWPSDANFILFRPTRPERPTGLADLARRVGPRARLFGVAGPRRVPAGHRGPPRGERPVPGRPDRKPAMSH